MATRQRRDYGLLGEDGRSAVEAGLANADWYRVPVERKRLKELMRRQDTTAIIHTVIWLGLIAGLGTLTVVTWLSWWTLLIAVPYGMLWALGGDSRCHEAGHGTAFRTRWMNDVVFQIGCFMTLREPLVRRWDHTRHHTDTIIVGRDREIIEERPPRVVHFVLLWTGLPMVVPQVWGMLRHSVGHIAEDEKQLIPESEWPKMLQQARIILAVHAGTIAVAIALGTILPLMLTSFATLYGAWAIFWVGLTQHIGLAEDVTDFRLNSRTVHMNPWLRFCYWNMHYHLEHHMYPMVPFHALKELHEEVKDQCPPTYRSTFQVYRSEIIPALRRQLKDPAYYIHRPLPDAA